MCVLLELWLFFGNVACPQGVCLFTNTWEMLGQSLGLIRVQVPSKSILKYVVPWSSDCHCEESSPNCLGTEDFFGRID